MRPDRKFCVLGELAKEVGWGYTDLVKRLETQRKVKEQAYYVQKKAEISTKAKAVAKADLSAVLPVLSKFGYN
jgi:large subunit ribosomal protein L13Ae